MVCREISQFDQLFVFRFYHEKKADANNRRSTHCLVFKKDEYNDYLAKRKSFGHDKVQCDEAGYYIFKFDDNGALIPGSNAPNPVVQGVATCRLDCDAFVKYKGLIKARGRAVQKLLKLLNKPTQNAVVNQE